ncbi:hypothetical protein ACHAWF_009307 [Thalassiosira exigua]
MDDSTFVPDRTDTTLRVDRNDETVASGMTECSWETPSVSSAGEVEAGRRFAATSLPPSRFRGGTARRFGAGGATGSGGSVGGTSRGSRGSRGSRLDRSARSGTSGGYAGFDPIAEEGESVASGPSFGGGGGGFGEGLGEGLGDGVVDRRTAPGDDNSIWMGSENSSVFQGSAGGGRRPFAAAGMFDGGSVASGRRSAGGGFDGGGFDARAPADERSSGFDAPESDRTSSSRSRSDRTSSSRSRSGLDASDGASAHRGPEVRPFGASTFDVDGDDGSVVSGVSYQRSVASQFQRPGPAPPPPPPPAPVRKRRASEASSAERSVGIRRDRPAAAFGDGSVSGGGSVRDDGSVANSGMRSVGSERHRPAAAAAFDALDASDSHLRREEEAEEEGRGEPRGLSQDERATILLHAYDNARLPHHAPKEDATREVDVSRHQDAIDGADEVSSLPGEYVLDEWGDRYHPKDEPGETEEAKTAKKKREELEVLPPMRSGYEPSRSPFSRKRNAYSLVTIAAAALLALAGVVASVRSLRAASYDRSAPRPDGVAYDRVGGGHAYLPGYQFGGGVGGIVGGKERERRIQLALGAEPYYGAHAAGTGISGAPISSDAREGPVPPAAAAWGRGGAGDGASNGATYSGGRSDFQGGRVVGLPSRQTGVRDPFHGMGPPRFPPLSSMARSATLTAAPLTSYSPPPSDDASLVVAFDPSFDGSILDLSVLPYNPLTEIPVFLDVPLSGATAVESVLGRCLRLVQCAKRGGEVLRRECEGEGPEGAGDDAANNEPCDPPLRTEMVYTSTYVNVDCTAPQGIDRGARKELATSEIADAIYTHQIHDAARLFAPPVEAYGRGFLVVRNPLERALAEYERLRVIDPEVKGMSLKEFAHSDHLEDNPLTRALTGHGSQASALGMRDLALAKEALKRKFVIGLFDRLEESTSRFETFFGWSAGDGARVCQRDEINRAMSASYNRARLDAQDGSALLALRGTVRLDVELHEFAKFLYQYQGRVLFGIDAQE